MSGRAVRSYELPGRGIDYVWQIQATGDFDGDGKTDIPSAHALLATDEPVDRRAGSPEERWRMRRNSSPRRALASFRNNRRNRWERRPISGAV
jgi:hypothetical protein